MLPSSHHHVVDLHITDGTDCPKDVKEEAVVDIGGLVRPPMNQQQFDEKFSYHRPHEPSEEMPRRLLKLAKNYYHPFTSWRAFKYAIFHFIPILNWLPNYNWKNDFIYDLIGGLTVGIMHVPNGVAYAMLAKQEAVSGLYISFFPPLIYMLLGTSRHNSIGSFAVVGLMTGLAVDRLTKMEFRLNSEDELDADPIYPTPAEVAAALSVAIGLVQLMMAILRLSFLTAYLSDQVVAGFSTGASFHVMASQLKDVFGLRRMPQRSGYGNMAMKVYDVISHLPNLNWIACCLSLFTITFLVIGKDYINPFIKKKLKIGVPIPFELLALMIGTTFSYCFNISQEHNIKIVKHIPTGIPTPALPRLSLMIELIPDAIGISVVAVAIHFSLAKMFAKKLNYSIDPGQELYALGLTSVGSGFFPVYPSACSLGRTLVSVSAGTRTQLATIPTCIVIFSCILYLGKFLEPLPMCVLASITCLAMSTMFIKFKELVRLWPLSKIDFSIWVVSFAATAFLDVMEGLAIAIVFALFTTVMREQWPRWHLLANVNGTMDYRDAERYEDVYFFRGICIFRFDSPLLFTNVERFRKTIRKAYRAWEKSHEFYILRSEREQILLCPEKLQEEIRTAKEGRPSEEMLTRHFIVDCSGFTFVDSMGVSAMKEAFADMRSDGILVYFAASKAPLRELFEQSGFYTFVAKENFYPTIRDAVAIARRRQLATGDQHDALYSPEHDRLSEIISSHPLH